MILDKVTSGASAAQIIARAQLARRPVPWILEFPCSPCDVLDFIPSFTELPVFFWRSVNRRIEIAASGTAFSFHAQPDESALAQAGEVLAQSGDKRALVLYACRFDRPTEPDDLWRSYPSELCWIPKTAIVRQDDRTHIRHFLMVRPESTESELLVDVEKLMMPTSCPQSDLNLEPLPPLLNIINHPDKSGWHHNVGQLLQAISRGQIEKAVLARRSDYKFNAPVDPILLMRHLFKHNEKTGAVLFRLSPKSTFISFTPERLFGRQGSTVTLEAISSTAMRSTNKADDYNQAQTLRRDDKALREHQFVVSGIAQSAQAISRMVPSIGLTDILSLDRVHHLMTPISAELCDGVDDGMLINRMHPTPAVGGTPTGEALRLLRQIEPFDRGWYAAPIGYTTGVESEFAVAIRSALVYDNCLSVYSGAGIVAGSDPDIEWDEVNAKDILQPLLSERDLR